MSRTTYVQIEGQLYEKQPDNSVIIGGQNYRCYAGRWQPEGHVTPASYTVIPDIQPYHSMIDGSLIGSRSTHRAHLREHGCVEVGNERPRPSAPDWSATRGLKEELRARINN